MGGGHKLPYEIPDWRSYKVDENTPTLMEVQRRLAARGLKDPWLRNEAWRYDIKKYPVWYVSAFRMMKKGFWPGLALALVSTAYTKYTDHRDHPPHHDEHH